jgi:hypothetical protein
LEEEAVAAVAGWGCAVQVEFSLPIALESAWFQPFSLKCDFPVSKFAFKCNLYHYSGGGFGGSGASPLLDGDGVPSDPNAVGELAAGSVATRGILFAPSPSHPAKPRWYQMKGPLSGKVFRAAAANLREVRAVVAAAAGAGSALFTTLLLCVKTRFI